MNKNKEIIYIEEYKEEVSIYESIKRVFLTGLFPFEYFEDISLSPDLIGPFLCILLLSLINFLYMYVFSYNVHIGYLKQSSVSLPIVNITDQKILIYPSNSTLYSNTTLVKIKDILFSRIYSDTIVLSLAVWLSTFIGMYLSSKVLGGETKSFGYISGYVLSAKIYEYLTRTVILYFLIKPFNIEVYVPAGSDIKIIVSYIVAGINKIGEVMILLKGHQVFFIIWNIIVVIAALNIGGKLSLKKAIIGGITSYIITGGLYLFITRIFSMI